MADLDQPQLWRLKGEGNANWVLSYAGKHPHLVGKVLRVRKPKPPCSDDEAALEDAVWSPVLGTATAAATVVDAAAARERAYVQELLVPLLGKHHVPEQQPVHPSAGFLHRMLKHCGCLPSSNCPGGDDGDDEELLAAALMPDVTLLPSNQVAAVGSAVGPMVCMELKPKCGFIAGDCATVHPDNRHIKRSRSRFQLHQLLKLAEGKIEACSAYDPCDLFSGDPRWLRSALAALLEQPQNNLLLFLDGQGQQLVGRQRSHKRQLQEKGGEAVLVQEEDELQPLQSAGNLAGKATPQLAQQQEQQALSSRPDERDVEAAVEELLEGLLPLPASQRRGALVDLLAVVLEQEEVLPRLLQAQMQCQYDIEGVYHLYCKLTGVPPAAIVPHSNGGNAAAATGSIGNSSYDAIGGRACVAGADEHATSVQRLLALPTDEAYAVLRSYVVAATAKDCAIMITLQRLEAAPNGLLAAGDGNSGRSNSKAQPRQHAGCSRLPQRPESPRQYPEEAAAGVERQQRGQQKHQQPQLLPASQHFSTVFCAAAGAWFAYRLSIVDLDLKPLAKIPKHMELDAAIVAAARQHLAGDGGGVDCNGHQGSGLKDCAAAEASDAIATCCN